MITHRARRVSAVLMLAGGAAVAAACTPRAGSEAPAPDETRADSASVVATHAHTDTTGAAVMPGAADTGMAMGHVMRMRRGMGDGMGRGAMAPPMSPEIVALGDSIFHGRTAGGTCYTCHGMEAEGTTLGPDLTDAAWLNGDGSFRFVVHTIVHGIEDPVRHPQPMPPMGGATLTHEQARAVAAYVMSLGEGNR